MKKKHSMKKGPSNLSIKLDNKERQVMLKDIIRKGEYSHEKDINITSKSLEIFKSNNSDVTYEKSENSISINNCWDDNSFYFKFVTNESLGFLEHLIFPKELFAIFHKDKGLYEFIYMPLFEKNERSFTYTYCGKTFKLYYGTPTNSFETLVQHYMLNNADNITDRTYNLLRFYNFYRLSKNNREKQPAIPTNFFIEGDFNDWEYDCHIRFFKHVNFMLSYYDRESPTIIILKDTKEDTNDIQLPCKSHLSPFPSAIYSNVFNTTLLELMEAAKETNSYRLKYIFYFQVLEYCSYYYIENKFKLQITNIIKSPDILNADKYSHKIIEIYSNYFKSNKDDKRMERLLLDFCTYDDIKNELKANSKYFIRDLCFDGGFIIKQLLKNYEEIENPPIEIISTIRKNIEAIRNVLVHARESRENAEIKPTPKNTKLIKPYLYLLRRIAETIIIKYEY